MQLHLRVLVDLKNREGELSYRKILKSLSHTSTHKFDIEPLIIRRKLSIKKSQSEAAEGLKKEGNVSSVAVTHRFTRRRIPTWLAGGVNWRRERCWVHV